MVAALSQTELTPAQAEMVGPDPKLGRDPWSGWCPTSWDVSKIEAGRLEIEQRVFDLHDELGGLIDLHQVRAQEKGLSFHADYGPGARGDFHGDSTRIKQVLGNLLSNAVKFTAKGEVGLAVEVTDPDGPGRPSIMTFEVRDTGVGFEAEAGAGLFQRFSQADTTITRRFGGTRLGLSICKALAEIMGGEITARSQVGCGSVFRVTLPLARNQSLADYDAGFARPAPKRRWPPRADGRARERLRILLARTTRSIRRWCN